MKTTIKHIANIQTGVYEKPVSKGDISYLQPKYFDEKGQLITSLTLDLNSIGITKKHILKKGDVLFASKGSKNFATCFNNTSISAVASTSFFVIRIYEQNVLPGYLTWFLNQPKTLRLLKKKAKGTAIVSIAKSALADLTISIPEIEKQEIILKTSQLRAAEKNLKRQIEILREQQIQQQMLNALK